ncbi:hypothetical protein QR685DRAFT_436206 [Neurospora intermedia]|uniref:Secreted protein n=1 Tax=Neurospora intermedia TaxID=5142 RepID=A0ABR3DLW9_NEUIN
MFLARWGELLFHVLVFFLLKNSSLYSATYYLAGTLHRNGCCLRAAIAPNKPAKIHCSAVHKWHPSKVGGRYSVVKGAGKERKASNVAVEGLDRLGLSARVCVTMWVPYPSSSLSIWLPLFP